MAERNRKRRAVVGLFVLLIALALIHIARASTGFGAKVTLPNGMVGKRVFNFTLYGRDDLFGVGGAPRLARDVGMICFNDRFVWISESEGGKSGLYDAEVNARVENVNYAEAMSISDLDGGRYVTCNGYHVAMTGLRLFYDGNREPFLPRCKWRNFANTDLQHPEFLERPCSDR
mgnify:CR=1 FL=1